MPPTPPAESQPQTLKDVAPPKPSGEARKPQGNEGLPRPFGRLTLLKPIARGGMGEVFLATSGGIEGAERPCVVKIIRREHAEDRSFLARFFDEARIQAQFDHPGVARILEASIDPSGKPFVVVEYVEGRNVAELRNRGAQLNASVAWPEAVAIAVSLSEALAHVHERTDPEGKPLEIVHRDLSPQNVMIGYGGDVKLIDFGTARGENRRCHTVSGVVLAKPGYVAPEVANNTPGGIPADLYALGVILWELVASRRFLAGDPQEHVRAVAAGRRSPVPVATLVGAPPELDTVIARLTAPRIEDRYTSGREAMVDLVRLLKKAPSLANGERGVRPRIAHLMERLYPAEPARSRAELARLTAAARETTPESAVQVPSPSPAPTADDDGLFAGTRYRILRELGRGAMAVVYEALHVDIGRLVALKVLPKERCGSAELESRFRSEARAIARLRQQNLVTLHDFGVSADGRPYYAMELLQGESLERYLDRERGMDWREAVRVGIEACQALESAHGAGLVHRDIKPGNLFLTREGSVKLLDFGVAQAGEDLENTDHEGALRLIGTVEYMAPEQASGHSVDERADLYALGVVLYELLTGHLPHVGSSPIALIDDKLRGAVEPPSRRAPQRALPAMLDRVLLRALRKLPEDRYQGAEEMRLALEETLKAPERARKRRRAVAVGAVSLAALGLFLAAGVSAQSPAVRARAAGVAGPIVREVPWVGAMLAPAPKAPPTTMDQPVAVLHEAPPPPPAALKTGKKAEPAAPAPPNDDPAPPSEEETDDMGGDAPALLPDGPVEDPLTEELARMADIEKRGNAIVTLNAYRKLAKKHPEEPRVLAGWSQAAIETKGWGEALRAAIKWASVDEAAPAQLHLAEVQKSVGQRFGAVATLERLLDKDPDNTDAKALLERYAPSRLALRK